ncbi:MAG: prepilin-type cleavage/methylation domain-containing protein [Methylotenera sp.]|nr:MAG: prepilin-type cleavage/methylation domain-containing protein [Methylotenera sp.]
MLNDQAGKQKGFTLVEIMVGLVIGLLVTLVVVNVFRVFEGQKKSTTGNSDAQTNGAIALYNIQRDAQTAGFALPVYSTEFSPFNCPVNTTINHDNNNATPEIGLSPVVITDANGANGSDSIAIRYGTSMKGGISVDMQAGTATNSAQVDTNIGCNFNDVVLIINKTISACSMARVNASPGGLTAAGVTPAKITLTSTTNVAAGNALSCLGVWNEVQYAVTANQLTRSGMIVPSASPGITPDLPDAAAVPMVPDIVSMQAQYGVSASANSNQVTEWVNATGAWANTATTPTLADRNRIKAIRVAVVARNGLLENTNVTDACSSLTNAKPTGLCAWDGAEAGSAAPAIDLSADANWRRYRYRVYESTFPIRNIIWSREAL